MVLYILMQPTCLTYSCFGLFRLDEKKKGQKKQPICFKPGL